MSSTELGANLAGGDDIEDPDNEMSNVNSTVSTVNSQKLKHPIKMSDENRFLIEQIKLLKIENSKLLNEVLETQKSYQNMLKTQAQDQNLFADVIRNFVSQVSHCSRGFERQNSHGYFSDVSENRKSGSPTLEVDETDKSGNRVVVRKNSNVSTKSSRPILKVNPDLKLNEWLQKNGVDDDTRIQILNADFSYEDFLYESDKEDVRRIGLRWVFPTID